MLLFIVPHHGSTASKNNSSPSHPVGGAFGASGYGHNITKTEAPNTYSSNTQNSAFNPGSNIPNHGSYPSLHNEQPPPYNPNMNHGQQPQVPNMNYGQQPQVPNGNYGQYPPPPYHPPGHSGDVPAMSQPQTIVVQADKPGVGQLIKESLVHSSVDAATKSLFNRVIPGGISGHSDSGNQGSAPAAAPAAAAPAGSTQITYNNYYNGQPASENPAPGNPQVPAANPQVPVVNPAPENPQVPAVSPQVPVVNPVPETPQVPVVNPVPGNVQVPVVGPSTEMTNTTVNGTITIQPEMHNGTLLQNNTLGLEGKNITQM